MSARSGGGASVAIRVSGVRHDYFAGRKSAGLGAAIGPALDGVDLEITSGEFVALLGPNGSGKSTLLSAISTALRPTSGEVSWCPESRPAMSEVRSRLGVVFQSPGLDALLTVRENLETAAAMQGMARDESVRRIGELADRLEIAHRLDQRCGTLSGGLRRRADLARAMLHGPDLLLLDEPGTGLDLRARRAFQGLVASLRAERTKAGGKPLTVVMSTHLMDEAEEADRVVLMHAGRVAADDSPERLRSRIGPAVLRVFDGDQAGAVAMVGAMVGAGSIDGLDERHGVRSVVLPEDVAERERVLSMLIERGTAFEYGRPTLGDAYLSLTGAALETEEHVGGMNGESGTRSRRSGRGHRVGTNVEGRA